MNFWMVRAGEGGYLVDEFERTGHVGVGWLQAGDLTPIASLDEMRAHIARSYPDDKPGAQASAASSTWKFRGVIRPGDRCTA